MGESCYEPLLYQTDFSNMSCCPLLLKYLRIHVIRLRTSVVSAVIRSKRLALLLLIPYYCVIKGETIAIDCVGSMTRLRLGIDSRNSVYGVYENQRRRLSRLKLSPTFRGTFSVKTTTRDTYQEMPQSAWFLRW